MMMEPINNLKIYYVLQRCSPEFEDEVITFYGKETARAASLRANLHYFSQTFMMPFWQS